MIGRNATALVLLGGVLLHAAEQDGELQKDDRPAPASYAVVIADRAVPRWFSDLRISGMRRVDRPAEADLLISIHGGQPAVEWTSVEQRLTTIDGRWRGSDPSASTQLVGLNGRGQFSCWVSIERRSAAGGFEPLTEFELSRTDAETRWMAPYSGQSYTWLSPVAIPTPIGAASAWGRQAWADAFMNAEALLTWQAAHSWEARRFPAP